MYEAIVTLVFPAAPVNVKVDGMWLDDEPAHTEVYRLEWDTEEAMRAWLDTSEHEGLIADQKMGSDRVEH